VKRLLAVVAGLALALVGTMAVAAWLSTGNGDGSVVAATLAPPTAVNGSPTAGTGDVTVSWTASTGTLAPTGYYVYRTPDDGPAEPACGTTASSPVTATTCTDTGVPLGSYTYTVVAQFHGWTSASAPSDTVVVARAGQTVTITSSPTSPTYGGTYTLTATGGASGNPVVFGTSTPTVCSVSGSTVSFVHAGTCTLTADQAGSAYYDAAAQVTQQFTVAKAAQTVTFITTAPTNAVVGGTGYTPTALGGGSGNPVTFTIDPAASAVCSISGGIVSYQHVGTCVVDADQAGDADHLAANRVQQSIAVGKGSQAVNFTSSAPGAAKVSGATYAVTATGGASGNPVTFSSATPSVCTVAGSTVSFVGAGTCTINADQAGSADYLAAAQVQQSFSVTKNDQTITFTSTAPVSRAAGTTYPPTATASSGLTVSFTVSGACSITSGTVTFGPAAGTCTINADQAGNTAYNAASQVQQSVTVTAGDTTAPTFVSTYPSGGSFSQTNPFTASPCGTGRVCATVSDAGTGVASVTYTITADNGKCWTGSTFGNPPCSTNAMSLNSGTSANGVWRSGSTAITPLVPGNNRGYTLVFTATDVQGNVSTATVNFTSS
jgi:hypothetical protein